MTWREIENGLPSNFGFGLTVSDAGSVFIVPLQNDAERFTCEGKLRVYRSATKANHGSALTKGLPQKNAYEVDPARRGLVRRQQHLFWHKERQALRLVKRRRFVEADRRLATRDLLREGLQDLAHETREWHENERLFRCLRNFVYFVCFVGN